MNWSNEQKLAVWKKGAIVPSNDPVMFRKDQCGAWIKWSDFENRDSEYGWDIDYITPLSTGGSDALSNLRPLQWQNLAASSLGRLTCAVTGSGTDNIRVP